jgi:hypothetical protein
MLRLGDAIFQRTSTAAADKEFPISIFGVLRGTTRETFAFSRIQAFRFRGVDDDINQGVWEHITPKVAVGGGVTFNFQNGDPVVVTNIDPTGQVAVGDYLRANTETDRTAWGEVVSIQPGTPSVTLAGNYTGITTGGGAAGDIHDFFTGSDDDMWTLAVNTDDVYATQGVNKIHKFDGTNEFAEVATSVPAKQIIMFNRRLILAQPFEGGDFQSTRIKWSAIGDPEDFTSITSGDEDLTIVPDPINQILAGRNVFAIYRENAVQTAANTGIVEAPFAFSHPIIGVGSLGLSAVSVGNVHYFLGRDNAYIFDMTTVLPIGDRVRTDIDNINFARTSQIRGYYNPNTREYQIFIPMGGVDFATDALIYYIPTRSWSKWVIPELTGTPSGTTGTVAAVTTHITEASDIWDDPPIPDVPLESDDTLDWDQDALPWDGVAGAFSPISAICTTDGETGMLDAGFTNDKGRDIQMLVETKDFDFTGAVQGLRRFDLKVLSRVRVTYDDLGTAFDLEMAISTDGGIIFGNAQVKSVGGGSGRREVFFDTWTTGRSFRLRFRKLNGNIHPRFVELGMQFLYRGKLRIPA